MTEQEVELGFYVAMTLIIIVPFSLMCLWLSIL